MKANSNDMKEKVKDKRKNENKAQRLRASSTICTTYIEMI